MKNTSVLCILAVVAALLLNACHKSEEIAENIGDPTNLSGVWRLEKWEYPGGSTYYSDLENDPWRMRLSEVEWRICLLIRLELSPSDMTKALCREASSISSIRSRLYAKVFGRKGSPRDWDEFILSL